jgi:hypothetical protein
MISYIEIDLFLYRKKTQYPSFSTSCDTPTVEPPVVSASCGRHVAIEALVVVLGDAHAGSEECARRVFHPQQQRASRNEHSACARTPSPLRKSYVGHLVLV